MYELYFPCIFCIFQHTFLIQDKGEHSISKVIFYQFFNLALQLLSQNWLGKSNFISILSTTALFSLRTNYTCRQDLDHRALPTVSLICYFQFCTLVPRVCYQLIFSILLFSFFIHYIWVRLPGTFSSLVG